MGNIALVMSLAFARFFLGVVIVMGLLHLLVTMNFTERLDNSKTYYDAIENVDAYNRIYDDILPDEAYSENTEGLLGGIRLAVYQEGIRVLRTIFPPEYLQEQVENNADRFTSYLRGETLTLEIYVELLEPIQRIPGVVSATVNRAIDALQVAVVDSGRLSATCDPQEVRESARAFVPVFQELRNGTLPQSVPTLQVLGLECRQLQFDVWFDHLISHPALEGRLSDTLNEERETLRRPFVDGDTQEFLRAAAEPITTRLTADAISDLRGRISFNDELDLLALIAWQSEGTTKQDILDDAELLRELVYWSNGPGKTIALIMVLVSLILLVLLHRNDVPSILRWVGITLFVGGLLCLIYGFSFNGAFPGEFTRVIGEAVSYGGGAPSSVAVLSNDVLRSLGDEATKGFVWLSVLTMVTGLVSVAGSLVWEYRSWD